MMVMNKNRLIYTVAMRLPSATMLRLFRVRPVKIWRHYDITPCVGFFQNDDNHVNIEDPIEILWLLSTSVPHHTSYVYIEKVLPRRMSTGHFCQEMAQNADLPISCKQKIYPGHTPETRPRARTQPHTARAVLFPDFCCCGSHNFQIVPARLSSPVCTSSRIRKKHSRLKGYVTD